MPCRHPTIEVEATQGGCGRPERAREMRPRFVEIDEYATQIVADILNQDSVKAMDDGRRHI
jgi:hypothetical protein